MENDDNLIILQLIPLKVRDGKIVSSYKNQNALQQMSVAKETTLFTISHYILRLSKTDIQNQNVVLLYANMSDKFVELPLSISAYHFLLLTNQKIGELRYSFHDKTDYCDRPKRNQSAQIIVKQSNITPPNPPPPLYQVPSFNLQSLSFWNTDSHLFPAMSILNIDSRSFSTTSKIIDEDNSNGTQEPSDPKKLSLRSGIEDFCKTFKH